MASGWIKMTTLALILYLQSSEGLSQDKFVIQPHPVQFNEDPHNWTVTIGASVSLTCNTTVVQVIGYINEDITPLPQIRWFHNNVMINSTSNDHFTINSYGIDTSILTITNITLLEQGEYHCVVNEWVKPNGDWWTKTRSRSGYITVIDNSSIVTVNSEENVVLSCVEPTAIVPSSRVVWIKDGIEMTEKVTNPNGHLLLFETGQHTSGHYQCINSVSNVTLLTYHVTINTQDNATYLREPLLQTDNNIENHYVTIMPNALKDECASSPVNQSVTLNCKASGYLSINWYKNGEVLDFDSEGTTFNQTTGDLIIRREDPCELLGVYQCFASNEIDTVQVSTRVLPFGWPNRPGRPELVSHNNRFTIEVKLHRPDYLGGLTVDDGLQYQVYVAYAGNSFDGGNTYANGNFYAKTDASNTSTITKIDLKHVHITGLNSLWNVYRITVDIVTTNRTLVRIAAFPEKSPPLQLNTLCDLVDFAVPTVEEVCSENSTSGLVTHNISWHLMGGINDGFTYRINNDWYHWFISGGCNYSNGTSVHKPFDNQLTNARYWVWELPKGSTCQVSMLYDTSCVLGKSSFNQQCVLPITAPAGNTSDIIPSSAESDSTNTPMIAVTLALSIVIITVVVSIVLCFCFRCSRRKSSTIKMLENAKELKMLQSACPISDDQQSVITSQTVGDVYTEKVNRWMEKLENISERDSDSAIFQFDPSEMLEQIVNGTVACKEAAPSHYIDCKTSKSNNIIPSSGRATSPTSFMSSSVLSRYITVKGCRLLSIATDSGMESSIEIDGTIPYAEYSDSGMIHLHYLPAAAQSTVPDHYMRDNLEYRTSDYDKLQGSNNIGRLQLTSVAESDSEFNDQVTNTTPQSTKEVGDYIGLGLTCKGHCVLDLTEECVNCVGVPKSTEKSDEPIKSELPYQVSCMSNSAECDNYANSMIDRSSCISKSTEKCGEYIGLEEDTENH